MSKLANTASSVTTLSFLQRLDLLPALISILTVGFLSLFTGIFRGKKGAPSLHLHIAYAVLRKATTRLSPLQLQQVPSYPNRFTRC
jgi:hypothetical protein